MNLAQPTSTPTVLPKLSVFSHDIKTRSTAAAPPPCCYCGRRIKHNNKHGIKNQPCYTISTPAPQGPSLLLTVPSIQELLSQKTNERENERMGKGFWSEWKDNSAEMSSKLAKLGLASVLAYGLFDGITDTTFFVLDFLGYEKSTGKNPAANPQALLG